jgi:hypothetical protein
LNPNLLFAFFPLTSPIPPIPQNPPRKPGTVITGFLGGFWGIGGIGEVKGKKANNKFGFKEDQVIKIT